MKAFLVPTQTIDHEGNRLATALWPVLSHAPPPLEILAVAIVIEDLPLALSLARHWGCMTQKRTSQSMLLPLPEMNESSLPAEAKKALAEQQTVIVIRSLSSNNLVAVHKARNKLEKLGGKRVEVGAITDELGKHDGLVVRIPILE